MKSIHTLMGMIALLGMILAPLATTAQTVTPDQEAAIASDPMFAAGAPHGDWSRVVEPVKFYLAGTGGTAPGTATDLRLSYSPGLAANRVLDQSYNFAMPVAQAPTNTIQVQGIDLRLQGNCATDIINPVNPSLTVTIHALDLSNGEWSRRDTSSASGYQAVASAPIQAASIGTATTFTHTFDFSANPVALNGGSSRLEITVAANSACQLALGPGSFATVRANSAAINVWPVDLTGKPIRSVTEASKLVAAQRNFNVHVAYASAWPCLNAATGGSGSCPTSPANNAGEPLNVMDGFWTSGALDLRVRDMSDQSVTTAGLTRAGEDRTLFSDIAPGAQARQIGYTYNTGFVEGTYRFEVFSTAGGVAQSRDFNVGGKGFEISSVDGQVHRVSLQEPTSFRLLVENTGTERDTIGIEFTTNKGGWDVRLINGQVTVEPGAQAEAILRVIPPANAIAQESLQITAVAKSKFTQEVDPKTILLRVELLGGQPTKGVTLAGAPTSLEVFPGGEIDITGLRLHNTGSQVGTYLITAGFGSGSVGWSASSSPPSRTVDAQSIDDFSVNMKSPSSAPPGQVRTLTISATLLGSTNPDAIVEIPVTVVFTPALEVDARLTTVLLRGDASTSADLLGAGGFNDRDHDRDAIFRVHLTNPTAVAQDYTLSSSWLRSAHSDCGTHHRGWQVATLQGDGTFASAGRTLSNVAVNIPALTTSEVFLKVNWSPASGDCVFDDRQTLTLTFESDIDRDFRVQQQLHVDRVAPTTTGSGGVNTGSHTPTVEMDRAAGIRAFADPKGIAVRAGSSYEPWEYDFRVINDGSEFDSFVVEIPPASRAGWTQTIEWLDHDVAGTYRDHASASPQRGDLACNNPTSGGRVIRCNNIGVGDHLSFRLTVTPPSNEALGRSMVTPLTVSSLDDSANKAHIQFETRTVGTFDHVSAALRSVTNVVAGGHAALPFVVDNVGTQGDSFTVSLTGGDNAWVPRFSSLGNSQEISVPGRSQHIGYLLVKAPDGAAVGTTRTFSFEVTSVAGGDKSTFSMTARVVAASTITIQGQPANDFVLANRAAGNPVEVVVSGLAGSASVRADRDALPDGWVVNDHTHPVSGSGAVTFSVVPPSGALSTSQVPLRVIVEPATGATAFADMVLSLEATSGIGLQPGGDRTQFVTPGASTRFDVDVTNLGLGNDIITFGHSPLPAGWDLDFESAQVALGPLASTSIGFDVVVPGTAQPRANVTFNLVASTSSGAVSQVTYHAIVGFHDIQISSNLTHDGAPEERLTVRLPVKNAGTLSDRVQITATVATPGYADKVITEVVPSTVDLLRNQSRDVLVSIQLGADVPSDVAITIRMVGSSLLAPPSNPVNKQADLTVHILPYKSADIDGDLVMEYAIDRNKDPSDGFESFADSPAPGGRRSVSADLARFLAPGRELAAIDGDGDGKIDHFIDDTGDGLPNVYWDPDDEHSMRLTIAKDVDADNIADYFVDTSGNGNLDKVYNVRTGAWTNLIVRDIDGDGSLDYVVDKNGNGQVDQDETILYSRGGILVTVQKVDVDGDGKLDEVFDIDGDGRPDYFVRNGETEGRAIILRDVNGDGILDWTYDSNLNGRSDSYYDPATKTGGHRIDVQQSFTDLVTKYWYVPVLFGLVLVLFVVLIAVTRR